MPGALSHLAPVWTPGGYGSAAVAMATAPIAISGSIRHCKSSPALPVSPEASTAAKMPPRERCSSVTELDDDHEHDYHHDSEDDHFMHEHEHEDEVDHLAEERLEQLGEEAEPTCSSREVGRSRRARPEVSSCRRHSWPPSLPAHLRAWALHAWGESNTNPSTPACMHAARRRQPRRRL
jgi:hypothetical protein